MTYELWHLGSGQMMGEFTVYEDAVDMVGRLLDAYEDSDYALVRVDGDDVVAIGAHVSQN